MLCRECPDRNQCRVLCEEAELYVGQDNPKYRGPGGIRFSPLETKILRFVVSLLDRREVRAEVEQALDIPGDILRAIISRLQQKAKQADSRLDT